jgi:AcrR family transcriptional regulator
VSSSRVMIWTMSCLLRHRTEPDYSPLMARQRGAGETHSRALPLFVDEPRPERADAAANRRRILAAAERLFAEHGVDAVSMDEVAAAARVGKGTIYRRFTDKSGLAVALIDDRERLLQQRLLSGPPPLGPGAPPLERLDAFVRAYVRHLRTTIDVVRLSETAVPGARFRIGSYQLWHRHVDMLLAANGVSDPAYCADAVLAMLAADLVTRQRHDGATWARIANGAAQVTRRIAGG